MPTQTATNHPKFAAAVAAQMLTGLKSTFRAALLTGAPVLDIMSECRDAMIATGCKPELAVNITRGIALGFADAESIPAGYVAAVRAGLRDAC